MTTLCRRTMWVTSMEVNDRLVLAEVEYHTDTTPLTTAEKMEYARLADTFLDIPYCPWTPNPGPQSQFLLDFGKDALYGGAVGGAKSVALMMAASQFLNVPGYDALLIRKHYTDLERPGALLDLASDWWGGNPDIKFNSQKHRYTFPCFDDDGKLIGHSRIEFGAMDTINDRFKYQGGRYHFVGYDELTQFPERDFTYLFSRMRRVNTGPLSWIPIRMRSTSNPGGSGHEWVYKRYIMMWERWRKNVAHRPRRNFHPATLEDNPHLDKEDYIESLMELDPVTRQQLLRGDWNIRPDGRVFKREWFKAVRRDEVPGDCTWVRMWDTAATDQEPGLDPDWTVGALVGRSPEGKYYIADIRRWRKDPGDNDRLMEITARHDGGRVTEAMEQEPGSGGKIAIAHYRSGAFRTTGLRAVPSSGKSRGRVTTVSAGRKTALPKILAAGPMASHANAGLFHVVVDGSWEVDDFLIEAEIFPDGDHDDQIDAVSGAVNLLAKMPAMGLPGFGDTNATMEIANQWRPDTVKNFAMDVASKSVSGDRIVEVREQAVRQQEERAMAMAVEKAWDVD